MDLGSLTLFVSVVMMCLLGAVCFSEDDNTDCKCSQIPTLDLTEAPPRCANDRFRYKCVDGYVRKAGTSNLIKCKEENGNFTWSKLSLRCIPDPNRPTTQPPKTTVTTGHTYTDHDIITTSISTTIKRIAEVRMSLIAVVIICLSIGAGFYCYRRRRGFSPNRREEPEEQVPMNDSP